MANLSTLASRLEPLLAAAVAGRVFPGAVAGIALGDARLMVSAGHLTYTPSPPATPELVYDLASLTKPLATTLAILALLKSGRIAWESTLPELLQHPVPQDKHAITLRQLLSHSSGLPAHRPYFQELLKIAGEGRRAALRERILGEELLAPPGQAALYSDLGFILLGWAVEAHSGHRLDRYVARELFQPWELEGNLFFRPLPVHGGRERVFAPSGIQGLLAGEVHDGNCHALGGVAGHAGLFGDINGVLKLGGQLLDIYHGRTAHPAFRPGDLQRALTCEGSVAGSSWGLGFDHPSAAGSSGGRYLSPESFGHLGFTGTSFWIDPARELVMVLLSNRVYPNGDNTQIRQFRPLFHDTVIQALGLGG